jgi:hypothetical protein
MATVTLWIDPNDDAIRNLPPVCMKCGAPATTVRLKRFTRNGTWIFFRRCQRVEVPLCEEHKDYWLTRRRMNGVAYVALGVVVVSFPPIQVAIDAIRGAKPGQTDQVSFLIRLGLMASLAVWLGLLSMYNKSAIRAVWITDRDITLTNVSPEFIRALDSEAAFDRDVSSTAVERWRDRNGPKGHPGDARVEHRDDLPPQNPSTEITEGGTR